LKGLGLLTGFLLAVLILPAIASAAECTDTWTGSSEGLWQHAENWSAGHVPSSTDVACIGSGKTVNLTSGTHQEVGVVQGEGSLRIEENSTLELANSTEASSIKSLTLLVGTLKGAGTIKVSGSFSWIEGAMKGSGSTVVDSGASGTIEFGVQLAGRTLVNEGTITYVSSYIEMTEGSRIENVGTFNANSEGVGIAREGEGTAPVFVNRGTFRKTEGAGATTIAVNFENKSTVKAESGKFIFFKPKSAVTLASSSVLEGSILFDGATVTGANFTAPSGTVTVEAGELTMETGTTGTIANLALKGGSISGAGTLAISSSVSWTGGTMNGSGSTVVGSGATATIEGPVQLVGRTLVNKGTITYPSSYIEMREGARIENSGTFNANSEGSGISREGGGTAPVFVNTGTFRKTTGKEPTKVGVSFTNNGTVKTEAGTLSFTDGGLSTGTWAAAEGTSIALAGGIFSFNGGGLEGVIKLTEASAVVEGLSDHNLSLTVSGSVFTSEGTLSITNGTIAVTNLYLAGHGEVAGAGTLEVTNSFTWTSEGDMKGVGKTVVGSGATGSIENIEGFDEMYERTLVNDGTLTFSANFIAMHNGATIENVGTFNANSEGVGISREGGGIAPLIVNKGTFQKTAGTGTTKVEPNFENLGTINRKSGTLDIENPVTSAHTNHFSEGTCVGDPVNCATGDFTETQPDFEIRGRGIGLSLIRTYDAQTAATAGSPGAFGYGWTSSFSDHLVSEESGKRITAVQGEGGTVPFTESGKGTFTPPAWSQDTLSGTSESGYTLTLQEQTKYQFSGAGKLEKVTDRNGNETNLVYNKSGQLETISDPTGRKITLAYNSEGLLESAKDPMGHVVKYAYEGKNLASVTMPGETEPRWKFKYDEKHRMTMMTNGLGGKTTNEYDSSNRVISQTDPVEHTTTFEYEPFQTKITNKATGAVTLEQFNSDNEPYSITRGYGTSLAATETLSYNSEGRVLSETDGNGHKTTYTYDSHGNRTSMVNADENETKWTYDETHDIETETLPGGEKTTIKRNSHGDPETIERPAPGKTTQTTSYTYNSHGQVESMTNPLKQTWKYEYDSAGDRSAEIDPESDKRTWAHNEDSQIASTVSPRGNETGAKPAEYTTTIERNSQGQPIKVTDPLGHETKYAYNRDANLESETDPNGHKTKYTYDVANEQIKIEKPNGNVMETEYDGAGQIKSQTDGNKHTTTYVRNVLEEPVEIKDPLGRVTKSEFDAAGNLSKVFDPLKRETTFVYDPANRLKEVSYSEVGTATAKYEYNSDGYLTHMTDGTGESSLTYDQLDRLTESKDGHGDTVGYEYNVGDEPTKITYPNGKSVIQEFDNADRLKSFKDWLEHTTKFAYNRDSQLSKITFPSTTGNVDTYTYSHADLMTEAKIAKGETTLASLAYARNKAGLIETTTSKGLPGAEKTSYTYDENNRLTKAGTASYEYDAANNLTKAPGTTNTYDKANELEKGTNVTYTYNELGERTKTTPAVGPATTYGYDQAGNLTSVKRPKEGETAEINDTHAYNGLRQLASRIISGTTKYLVWNTVAKLPVALSDGESSYVYGPGGLPVEQISSTETPTYYHHDELGSTRVLTTSSGETTATFTYTAYGAPEGSTGTLKTPIGYAGQYTESDSGLQYLRTRYYDPATGQFLTADPAYRVSRSQYGYSSENPVTMLDPTGLQSVGTELGNGLLNSTLPLEESDVSPLIRPRCSSSGAFVAGCEAFGGAVGSRFVSAIETPEYWVTVGAACLSGGIITAEAAHQGQEVYVPPELQSEGP